MRNVFQPLTQRAPIWLEVIQHGFIVTLPVVILGAFALTLLQMLVWFAPHLQLSALASITSSIQQGVYGFMALILVLSISFRLAKHYHHKFQLNYDPMVVSLLSMVCLAAMVGLDYGTEFYLHLGVTAVAKALFCAVIFTELFVWFYRYRAIRISYLNQIISNDLHTAIRSLFPAIIAPAVLLIIYALMSESIKAISYWFPLFMGEIDPETGLSAWQSIKFILVNQLSWFVGVHGSSIVEIHKDLMFSGDASVVYSRQYINMFAHIGGAGGTLGLVIALLVSKRNSNRQLGRYALLPSMFNINELIIFGLPIIFNRFLLLPFVLVPLITAGLFRFCFEMEWIQWQGDAIIWSTPVLLGGYLSTGQWNGVLLQIICVAISFALYWPCLKLHEKHQAQQEAKKYQEMLTKLNEESDLAGVYQSQTPLAQFCRMLLNDLNVAMESRQLELHYQPKVNSDLKVVGAEALLRWRHERLGSISPALIVQLAEISGDIHRLGRWVVDQCMQDVKVLDKAGLNNVKVALNVSPIQLNDPSFFTTLIETAEQYQIDPSHLEIEITEGQQIELTEVVLTGIQNLSTAGFSIAVDDFGMGYTSLRYLKTFPVNTLKIDGSIVRDVMNSSVVQEIISSMSSLSHSMNVELVAEWVETEAQLKRLTTLGCDQFQGKHMSMPVPLAEFASYCAHQGVEK